MRAAARVLIVDDDKSSGQVLSEVVRRLGLKPILVTKGNDALNVVKLQSVSAAIVDVLLPKMSGVDLVKEFRETKFADAPVVLVSGIFKDKAFATEAISKTDAKYFLFKPFGADELMASINKAFAGLLVTENWSVQTLLTKKLTSVRERSKAIENLNTIKGLDFPFVLTILMESGASGHLNIINDSGEIFGVTLSRGTIAEVDGIESRVNGVLSLISQGFLAQDDWDEFQKNGSRRFSLERLVLEGLISPHAVAVAKHDQILIDFKAICAAPTIQINFVGQDDSDDPPKHAVEMSVMHRILRDSINEMFTHDYLVDFFAPVQSTPFTVEPEPEVLRVLIKGTAFEKLKAFMQRLLQGGTLKKILEEYADQEELAYQCFYFLVLSRAVTFNDAEHERSMQSILDRYKNLYSELKDRDADKVFQYFGAPAKAQVSTIKNLYEVYLSSNHPDHALPEGATPELVDYCNRCLKIITDAYDVMTNDEKRAEVFEKNKQASEANRKRSNELTVQAYEVLKANQYQQAIHLLLEAEKIFPTTRQFLIMTWAQIKLGTISTKPQISDLLKKLDTLSAEDKKSAFYYMVMGLAKKQVGDPAAVSLFEKVLEIDGSFVLAKREINTLQTPRETKDKSLLTGDITDIVTSLFRRKAE